MSGRIVPQFALAGLLAAALASPSVAQSVASSPEVAPMPREKGAAIEFEFSIVPASGIVGHSLVVPPPPRCAFDCQLNPVPTAPGTRQAYVVGGSVNSDAGLTGNVIINERNFDILCCPTSSVVPGLGVMKFEWVQNTPTETIHPLPRNLVDLVGDFVYENCGGFHIVRFKAPASATQRGVGQNYPYPVLGLTTIRWDESGGGWWVETVRVPQPQEVPTQNGKPELHGGSSWNSEFPYPLDRLEEGRTCSNPTPVGTAPTPCSVKANKLTGTWVREMDGSVIAATAVGDELKICLSQSAEGITLCITLTADYTLTKEGLVHGVITGIDIDTKRDQKATNLPQSTSESGEVQMAIALQDLVDCPFSFRTRMTSAGLMVSNLKMASLPDAAPKEVLALLGGMYKLSKDGSVPVPKTRKPAKGLNGNVSPVADGATGTDVLVGSKIGAGAGALLGAVCHPPLAGATTGGVLGDGAGALLGKSVDQPACQANQQATATAIAQAPAKLIQPVDVVLMTKNGFDESIIIDQFRISGCTPLDPSHLQYLQQNGVSSRVIAEMQSVATRLPTPVMVVGPPQPVYGAPPPSYYYNYNCTMPLWGSNSPAPPAVPMMPPPPVGYPQGLPPVVPMGSALPASNNGMTQPQAKMVIHFSCAGDASGCPLGNPPMSSVSPGAPVAQVQSQRASDKNFTEQYYKNEWATPPPANVPAPAFDALADAFGQMLYAQQTPPVAVTSPQAGLLCPVQPTCGSQASGVVLPPCAAAVAKAGPVGTWVRVVGPMVYVIRITPDHMIVTATSTTEIQDERVVAESIILTADYHLMRDGTTMVGLITSFDARLDGDVPGDADFDGIAEELSHLQKAVTDKPFALSVRVYGDALAIGNVRLPEVEQSDAWSPLTVLGGRYSAAGDKPLPKPKITKIPMPPQGFPPPPQPIYGYPTGIIGAPTAIPMLPPPGIPQGAMPLPPAQPCFTGGSYSGTYRLVSPQNPGCGVASPPGCPSMPHPGVISGCGGVLMPPPPPTVQFGPPPIPAIESPAAIPAPSVDALSPRPIMPEPTPPAAVEVPVTGKKSKKKQSTQEVDKKSSSQFMPGRIEPSK